MSRRVDFTLTTPQLTEIEQAINTSPHPEVRQRAIAIRLLHLGHKPEAVAEMVAITANTIWTWHRRWRQEGIAGLADRPKSGRKSKANTDYMSQLEAALTSDPQQLGLRYPAELHALSCADEQTGLCLATAETRPQCPARPVGSTGRTADPGLVEKNIALPLIAPFQLLFLDETTLSLHPPYVAVG